MINRLHIFDGLGLAAVLASFTLRDGVQIGAGLTAIAALLPLAIIRWRRLARGKLNDPELDGK